MNRISRNASLFSLAGLCAFAATRADWAEAYEARPAAACYTQNDFAGDYVIDQGGIRNQSGGLGGRARELFCPLPNTGAALSGFWVTAKDNNNGAAADENIRVRGCSSSWGNEDLACSTYQALGPTVTYTGVISESVGGAHLTNINTLAHRVLMVSVPQNGIFGHSRLIGYEAF